MLLKVRPRRKLLVAGFAHIGLLSGVDTLVTDQVRNLRKGLVATVVFAPIGLLFIMDTRMLLK